MRMKDTSFYYMHSRFPGKGEEGMKYKIGPVVGERLYQLTKSFEQDGTEYTYCHAQFSVLEYMGGPTYLLKYYIEVSDKINWNAFSELKTGIRDDTYLYEFLTR